MPLSNIPPWGWALGAVGLGAGVYFYKKHGEKAKEELESTKETASEAPVIAGVENPAEEFPYSIGGLGGGGAGALGNALESGQELRELFGQQSTSQREGFETLGKTEKETAEAIARLGSPAAAPATVAAGSGGGAPTNPTPGVTAAPASGPAAVACGQGVHAGFPLGSPNDCYRISRTKTGGGCECHGHQNGRLECQTGKAPHCVW